MNNKEPTDIFEHFGSKPCMVENVIRQVRGDFIGKADKAEGGLLLDVNVCLWDVGSSKEIVGRSVFGAVG